MPQVDKSVALIIAASASVQLGIVVAWWPNLEFALALEQSPLAWLQSSLLVACALCAAMRASIEPSPRAKRLALCWAAIAITLLLAALDERFMGHEQIQEYLRYEWFANAPAAGRWVQSVILLYLLGGTVALWWLRRQLDGDAFRWCAIGVAIGAVALGLDVAFESVGMQVIEELLEAAAETAFLCGLFIAVRTAACRPR